MSEGKKTKVLKKPTLFVALIPIIALIAFLYVGVVLYEQDPHIPLVMGSCVAVAVAVFMLGHSWPDMEEGIIKTIGMGMQACLILMIIGMIIGSWIMGGIVPGMIYYGLQILSPSIFLVAAMLLCSVVSLASGSSWTTAGTVGVALIGIAQGIGIPAPVAAGAIISGAYFGDKMSPLSDTTNLAPAMAGAKLFDHIKHMVYTTGPSYIIAMVLFGIMSMRYAGQDLDSHSIQELLDVISGEFTVNPLMLVPPLLVIAMVIFKVPAIPGLIGGVALGFIYAMVFQGASFGDALDVVQNGFVMDFGEGASEAQIMIGDLLTNGGMQSMLWTVSLIICALSFGGILESTGMLEVIAQSLLSLAKGTGSLVAITIFSSIFINIISSDQYLAIVIPGRMYKDAYMERGLAPRNLSRTLEDGGTITSPLVPWNTCGAAMSRSLGVPTVEYIPYCFLNLVNPIVSILLASFGLFQMPISEEEKAAFEASKATIVH